jgi:hypothetical protein
LPFSDRLCTAAACLDTGRFPFSVIAFDLFQKYRTHKSARDTTAPPVFTFCCSHI